MATLPIKSIREMRQISLGELYDYHITLVNEHNRSERHQAALEQSARIMLQKQKRLRDQRTAPARTARPGYVYLVESGGVYKIGRSGVIPKRIRFFGIQLPFPTRLIHTVPSTDMVWAENQLHQTFAHCRLNGEWFALSPGEVAHIQAITRLDPL